MNHDDHVNISMIASMLSIKVWHNQNDRHSTSGPERLPLPWIILYIDINCVLQFSIWERLYNAYIQGGYFLSPSFVAHFTPKLQFPQHQLFLHQV